MRQGEWKLVAKGPIGKWELYDMETDRTEMHDLATSEPQRVAEMSAECESWAKRRRSFPGPGSRLTSRLKPLRENNNTRGHSQVRSDERLLIPSPADMNASTIQSKAGARCGAIWRYWFLSIGCG